MVLISSLGKFKQLPNGFRLRTFKQLPNALLLASSSNDQRFWSRVLGKSNNCPKILVLSLGKFKQLPKRVRSWEVQTNFQRFWSLSLGKFKQLPNGYCLEAFKQLPNALLLASSSNDQRFWSRVLGKSNNCPKILVLSLGKFKQLPKRVRSWEVQTNFQRFWSLSLGKFKQLTNIYGLGKIKKLHKGFGLESREF